MSCCSSLPLPLNPLISLPYHKLHALSPLPFSKPSFSLSLSKSRLCFSSSSSSNSPTPDREDILWLREEQRWLREEQRWLREEQRWLRERESLLAEIQSLKLQIQALESQISTREVDLVPETIANVRALLQVLTEKNQIPENGSSASPMVLEEKKEEVVKEVISVEDERRETLRKGSEGEDVRLMQEALQKLGFYSGEEDMEYSSFSSGTERAVKTWQATLGAPEDGIMTAELLDRLYMEQKIEKESTVTVSQKEGANGTAVSSVTERSETQRKVIKEEGGAKVETSQHRVFLLGENRWEEPSRLIGRDEQVRVTKTEPTTKCLQCRGEGRLLCTECDGTGEPNIESQFLEWVDEGTKCPYCEGLGYTVCDVCGGKMI